jgi:hypothetical protein
MKPATASLDMLKHGNQRGQCMALLAVLFALLVTVSLPSNAAAQSNAPVATHPESGQTGDMPISVQGSYRAFREVRIDKTVVHELEGIVGTGWRLNRGRIGHGIFGVRGAFGGSTTEGKARRVDRSWVSLLPGITFKFLPVEERLDVGVDPGLNFWDKAGSFAFLRIEAEIGAANSSSMDLRAAAPARASNLTGHTGGRVGLRAEAGISAVLAFTAYRREFFNGSELEDFVLGTTFGRPSLPFGISIGYRRIFSGSFDREFVFLGFEFEF